MLVRRFSDAAVTELHRLQSHILMDAGELGSRNVSVNWLEVPPGASEELRSHEEAEQVYVVVSGTGTMSATGDTQRLEVGDLVLIPPATDHAVANDRDDSLALRLGPVASRLRRRALQPPPRSAGRRLRRLRRRRVITPAAARLPPPSLARGCAAGFLLCSRLRCRRVRARYGGSVLVALYRDFVAGANGRWFVSAWSSTGGFKGSSSGTRSGGWRNRAGSRGGFETRPRAPWRRCSRASRRPWSRWCAGAHEGPRGADRPAGRGDRRGPRRPDGVPDPLGPCAARRLAPMRSWRRHIWLRATRAAAPARCRGEIDSVAPSFADAA